MEHTYIEGLLIREGTSDLEIYNEIFEQHRHKIKEFGSGAVVLDVGAYTGLFGFYCLSKGAQFVFCYEPQPSNFEVLQLHADSHPGIIPFQKAVVGKKLAQTVNLSTPNSRHPRENETNYAGCSIVEGALNTSVICVTFDSQIKMVLDLLNIDIINYLKMDCEGAEWEIIGNSECFNFVDKMCLEYHLNGIDQRDVSSIIDRLALFGLVVEERENHPQGYEDCGTIWFRRK